MGDSPLPVSEIVVLGVCLLFSGFFSGTETALTALSQSRCQQLIDEGDRWAPVLRRWIKHPTRILTTLLVGNNLVNILGSILAYRVADYFLNSYVEAMAVAAMTLIVLVFGEVTPKTYAKHNPERVAIPAMYLVRIFEFLFFPLAVVLARFGRVLVRLFGGKDAAAGPTVTEGEIEYMIELGQKEGAFEEPAQGTLMASALEFKETIAKEVMIPRTAAHFLQLDTPVDRALEKVIAWGHSRVPVFGEDTDHVEGVLYAKDLLQMTAYAPPSKHSLRRVVRRNLLFVPETQRISDTLGEMRTRRLHLGVVVDEFGGTSGLITIEDILEELVGEIRDEYDREEEPLRQVGEGIWVANAQISIGDLGELLDVEFPDNGEYESLGGMIVNELGRVPEPGAEVRLEGLAMKVTAADERRVARVQIERLETGEDSQDSMDSVDDEGGRLSHGG
ncbi:MAG: hemolysin family protein [Myxococcota bacterium]|nr:hemolysin family protein [Myxococcota bacterium]